MTPSLLLLGFVWLVIFAGGVGLVAATVRSAHDVYSTYQRRKRA